MLFLQMLLTAGITGEELLLTAMVIFFMAYVFMYLRQRSVHWASGTQIGSSLRFEQRGKRAGVQEKQ